MKRRYQKPEIAIENFFLSENVAACEDQKYTFSTKEACGNNADDLEELKRAFGYFTQEMQCSDTTISEGEILGTPFCYHTSTGVRIFSS